MACSSASKSPAKSFRSAAILRLLGTMTESRSAFQTACAASSCGRERASSDVGPNRSEEHTSELQSLMRISYAVFCLKKKKYTSQEYKKNLDNLNQNHKKAINDYITTSNTLQITNNYNKTIHTN